MRNFGYILFLSGLLTVIFWVITSLLPQKIVIYRTISIQSSVLKPYENICYLKNWRKWYPLFKMDANIKLIYGKICNQKYSSIIWKSKKKFVGNGEFRLVSFKLRKQIAIKEYHEYENTGIFLFHFVEKKDSLIINLEYRSELSFFERWNGLFVDNVIGTTLETCLKNIKEISEK